MKLLVITEEWIRADIGMMQNPHPVMIPRTSSAIIRVETEEDLIEKLEDLTKSGRLGFRQIVDISSLHKRPKKKKKEGDG